MNILGKNLAIILVLFLVIPSAIYLYIISIKESFTNSTNSANSTKQPGTYVMTNTTYDTNGNIIVKTMDTSGNFSVNTYGSTIINQMVTPPPATNTATTTVNPAKYQMQLLPADGSTAPTSSPVITSNDISAIASAGIAAAMNAYHQSQGTVTA